MNKKNELSCPECGKTGFTAPKGLASHRLKVHGVAGTGKSTIAARKLKALAEARPWTCPDCEMTFDKATALGSHRRTVHGVLGMSEASVRARTLREQAHAHIERDKDGNLICPECGYPAKNIMAFSIHRKQKHRVMPIAPAHFVPTAPVNTGPVQCADCDFVAKDERGLRKHRSAIHKAYSQSPTAIKKRQLRGRELHIEEPTQTIIVHANNTTLNGHHASQEAHPAPASDPIPEAVVAIGLGRFQELSRQLAFEHDLPPRLFASRLAGLIYAATVR